MSKPYDNTSNETVHGLTSYHVVTEEGGLITTLAAYYDHSRVTPRDPLEGCLSRVKYDFITSRGNAKMLVISSFG